MFEPGGSSGVSGAVRTAPELTAALTETQRAVNRLDARRVHDAYDLLDVRLCAEFDRQERSGDGDAVRASKAAANDVSVALNVSFTAAATMLDAGEQLWHRLPLIDTEFTAGALDYARIKVITGVLAQASDATVAVLEPDVLAAAHLYNTRALRDTIWELWTDHNPGEAAEARARNLRSNIGVRRSKRHDGGTDVTITTSDHSADDFLARIAELVDTVCENDTRSKGELQAAAVTAMAHGSTAIECTCTRADCPVRGAEIVPAPKKRIAAYMDIELLLGLTSNPPTLADGTPLPADVARLIATDAQWQIILTDMLDLAAPEIARRAKQAAAEKKPEPNHDPEPEDQKGPTSNQGSEANDLADDAGSVDAPESSGPKESETDSTTPRKSAPPPPTVAPACRQRTRVMRRRSRIYTAAPLPEPDADQVHRPRLRGWHTALLAHIADLLAAIDRDPALARGVHPDGHGGHNTPPRGALTYAPTAEVKALVLARYRTCTAPGCHRPSADCQLDHVVEFDHDNPLAGGWTVVGTCSRCVWCTTTRKQRNAGAQRYSPADSCAGDSTPGPYASPHRPPAWWRWRTWRSTTPRPANPTPTRTGPGAENCPPRCPRTSTPPPGGKSTICTTRLGNTSPSPPSPDSKRQSIAIRPGGFGTNISNTKPYSAPDTWPNHRPSEIRYARMVFALIVTGPPGAGKSRVLSAVHDELGESGQSSAMFEVDELERSYPPLEEATTMSHVKMLAASFRRAGCETLCVTATTEDDEYLTHLIDALEADQRMVVRLEAAPDTLERRIREREPENWAGIDELVRNSRSLAQSMTSLAAVDLVVSTEGRIVEDVAVLLLSAFRRYRDASRA